MARLLYVAATGPQDMTRCSIAFHLAANGAAVAGHEAGVVLAGEATELMKADVRSEVRGVGIPPLGELFESCRDRGVGLFVWKGCAEARGVGEQQLEAWNARFVSPPDVARLSLEADRVLTF